MPWGNIVKSVVGSVSKNPLDWAGLALSGVDYLTSRNDASKAQTQNANVSAQQLANAERIAALNEEGGQALAATLASLVQNYGNFGAITPGNMDAFSDFVSTTRLDEEQANRDAIAQMLADITATTHAFDERDRAELSALEAEGRGLAKDYYRTARAMTAADVNNIIQSDINAKMSAPQWQDGALDQDLIGMKFAQIFDQQTDRELASAYGRMVASLPPGMENSTMAVEMHRALAGEAATKRNENLLRSVEAARDYIQGLQGTASNTQGMQMSEREMSRAIMGDQLAARELNYGLNSRAFADELRGGEYGIRVAGAGRDIRDQNLNYTNVLRGAPISEFAAIRQLPNRTAVADWETGAVMLDNASSLRGKGIEEASKITTAPYTFTTQGLRDAGSRFDNSARIASSNLDYYTKIAQTAAQGLGTQIRRTFDF